MKAMPIRAACCTLLAAAFSTLFALPASAAPPFLLRQISLVHDSRQRRPQPLRGGLRPQGVS